MRIDGLSSIKHCNYVSQQLMFLLVRARVQLHNIIDVKYPSNCYDSAVLYFKNAYARNTTKVAIKQFIKNHFTQNIKID